MKRMEAALLDDTSVTDPYTRLCVHVIRQALRDCIVRPQNTVRLAMKARANAEDAFDFLLHRMWRGDSVFGEILRDQGVAPFSLDVVSRLIQRLASGELSRTGKRQVPAPQEGPL